MALSPSERSQRASIAALTRWSRQDGIEGTHAAREAFNARFEREVDPERVLPEAERARRAERARKAFYKTLAYKSARARRQRRDGTGDAA